MSEKKSNAGSPDRNIPTPLRMLTAIDSKGETEDDKLYRSPPKTWQHLDSL